MGAIAEKLDRLAQTKAELKAALAEKGQMVGDVFSAYPAAVRAISSRAIVTKVSLEEFMASEEKLGIWVELHSGSHLFLPWCIVSPDVMKTVYCDGEMLTYEITVYSACIASGDGSHILYIDEFGDMYTDDNYLYEASYYIIDYI